MTRSGRRCRNSAVFGDRYCDVHLERGPELEGEAPRCQGLTRTGERCKIPPVNDSPYCGFHRDQALLESERAAAADGAVSEAAREVGALIAGLQRRPGDSLLGRLAGLARSSVRAVGQALATPGVGGLGQAALALLRSLARTGEPAADGSEPAVRAATAALCAEMLRQGWPVDCTGLEHLPREGPALLACNRAGLLPWDGLLLAAVLAERAGREARVLFDPALVRTPYVGTWLLRAGHRPDVGDHAARQLAAGELAIGFPEGERGAGRTAGERWTLQPFDDALLAAALSTGAPVLPVAIDGAWDSTPTLMRIDAAGPALALPFLPITPTFPWLGPLGLLPYPARWRIEIGEPLVAPPAGEGAAARRLRDALAADLTTRLDALRRSR